MSARHHYKDKSTTTFKIYNSHESKNYKIFSMNRKNMAWHLKIKGNKKKKKISSKRKKATKSKSRKAALNAK